MGEGQGFLFGTCSTQDGPATVDDLTPGISGTLAEEPSSTPKTISSLSKQSPQDACLWLTWTWLKPVLEAGRVGAALQQLLTTREIWP